ncbi:MAG: hypothetical protein WAV05_01840 [Anaerolineales bacterium]
MKTRIIIISLITILILASGAIASAHSNKDLVPSTYQITSELSAGNGYQIIPLTWQISGALNGGNYFLDVQTSPTLRGSGCCCTFLPCIKK